MEYEYDKIDMWVYTGRKKKTVKLRELSWLEPVGLVNQRELTVAKGRFENFLAALRGCTVCTGSGEMRRKSRDSWLTQVHLKFL